MMGQRIILILLLFLNTSFLSAQNFSKPVLRWGGDSEGGAPYSFLDPDHPQKIIGFEVDLAAALAAAMGMEAQFVQNQWDGLIPGLQRGNYDLVINGLEITEDRKEKINFSIPYYVTYEQLVVRKETNDIYTLEDCYGRSVGALKFSLAERILRSRPQIHVMSYEGDFNAFEDLANSRIDAVLMDYPLALYYGKPHPKLKLTGFPISRIEYGIGVRKEDTALLQKVDSVLIKMMQDGSLRRILEQWGLWTDMMAEYLGVSKPAQEQAIHYERFLQSLGRGKHLKDRVWQYLEYIPLLGKGAIITLELSILSMAIAMLLGLAVCLIRLYLPRPLPQLAMIYTEIIRGTPLLIQLFFIFYGLPNIGIKLSPFLAAVVGLAINYSAYEAELYRAGILSIPKGQMEAALALGMSRPQAVRHIILPQALRVVIPPMTNDFIALLKDSSLVSVITMVELTKVYGQLATTYYDYFGIGLLAAAMYLFIGLPFVRLSRWAEKYFAAHQRLSSKVPTVVAKEVRLR